MCERCAKGLKTRFSFARSRPPIWRRDGTSRLKQAPAIVPEISLQNPRQVEPVFICAGEGGFVTGVAPAPAVARPRHWRGASPGSILRMMEPPDHNPPIRVGKEAVHELLGRWLPRLAPGAPAWLVVHKHLGGDSLAAWLTGEGYVVTRRASKQGYRVLEVVAR